MLVFDLEDYLGGLEAGVLRATLQLLVIVSVVAQVVVNVGLANLDLLSVAARSVRLRVPSMRAILAVLLILLSLCCCCGGKCRHFALSIVYSLGFNSACDRFEYLQEYISSVDCFVTLLEFLGAL
mmetsp:Transcript_22461/g.30057  ORF Transcript_22461/g.30057 Transcript_22461/m.30057 type:complete len:125 (+) Transcript_22461:1938-2312(+)